jgi:hypothetical protein
MTPSLSLNFIGKSILEGALFAPTTFQAFKLFVALTSIADFQLIVNLFLNPNCEGACADVASATICNKSFKLIDVLSSKGNFSVSANFGNKDSEGARAPSTTFPTLHNRKSEFIVASHYSKTFLHFSKDFAIFCEGDWENVNNENNSKDDEVAVRQKLNLPSSALLVSVLLAFALLALVHICFVGRMDPISLVGLSGQISAIGLVSPIGLIGLIGLIGYNGFGGFNLSGLSGLIRLIGLESVTMASVASLAMLASASSA